MYKIIGTDGRPYGPVSAEEIRRWIAENRVNAQTLGSNGRFPGLETAGFVF